jgi:NhaP-type Na+/H+ or K+/H+ antiporter
VLGEALHTSPVMAVIVAGLVIGGLPERITTAPTRLPLHSVYQTVIFLLESDRELRRALNTARTPS